MCISNPGGSEPDPRSRPFTPAIPPSKPELLLKRSTSFPKYASTGKFAAEIEGEDEEATVAAVQAALDGDDMTIIVSKCDSGNIEVPVIDMDAPVIRHRFMTEVSRHNT